MINFFSYYIVSCVMRFYSLSGYIFTFNIVINLWYILQAVINNNIEEWTLVLVTISIYDSFIDSGRRYSCCYNLEDDVVSF